MIRALTMEATMTNFKRSVLIALVFAMVVPCLILVNGNPLENIDLVADLDKIFSVIMKDGKIYKNTIK